MTISKYWSGLPHDESGGLGCFDMAKQGHIPLEGLAKTLAELRLCREQAPTDQ